ncbi:xylulokinase [Cohnella silvisoli]|uniref:FGGY family carbohydrate kinase n=1 Tax=Cohnella silvisoli TaxID=2873699 RepID=A0ABV1KT09_9BACL|nr:FGGY family carbohydrate kinase [Cohnella silvisoli]MCD9021354.1 hypothetical protein [Cohnella silvisoli]
MKMSDRSILTLDIGSSSCKAVVIDGSGREMASGSGEYPVYFAEGQTFAEQEPDEIWQGVCEAVGRALARYSGKGRIAAISLSSQISSHFLVGTDNRPLTRIITWMDSRANDQAERMKQSFTPEQLFFHLGAELPPGSSWPIPKLSWLSRYRPAEVELARYMVQPKEWVLWKMTGEWMTDLSSARGAVHQQTGEPADVLLAWAGVSRELIPPVGEPHQTAGTLTVEASELLGLARGLPVMLGWNDLNAAILGTVDWTRKGFGFDITGTSEHIGLLTRDSSGVLSPHHGINKIPFLQGYQTVYGVTSSGGHAFKWYAEQIACRGGKPGVAIDFGQIAEQAAAIEAGADGLIFLPYLNGERAPWWNPHARGVFFGLHFSHRRPHLARAVLEGVGFALRSILERLPYVPSVLVTAGGASKLGLWNQIKADILGVPVSRTQTTEAGCLGAAVLAAYGLGWYGSLEEAGTRMVRTGEEYTPRPQFKALYDESYGLFTELYLSLVELYQKSANRRDEGVS